MFKLTNPLPQAVKDTSKLRNFYREWNLVPYAGNTTISSHTFLKLLCSMYDLSPSHGACIDDLSFWSFEGELDIVEPLFGGRYNEISEAEKNLFFEFLDDLGVSDAQLIEVTRQLFLSWKKAGIAYLHYREIRIGGTLQIFLDSIDPMNAMFLNTSPEEPRAVVISKDFFSGDFQGEDPRLIRVYPAFSGEGNIRETIFVIRNKRDYSDWYGRPDSLEALFWMYSEWSIANLTAKVSASEVTSKALFAMERPDPNTILKEDDPEKAFKKMVTEVRRVTTNRGDYDEAESLGVIGYPHGAKPPTVLKLDINRDKDYLNAVFEVASSYIFAAHRWSKTLTGLVQAKSNIGGNILIDEFLSKNTSVIKPIQRRWEREWRSIFRTIAEAAGRTEFDQRTIRFEDKVSSLVESLSDGQNASNNIGSPDAGEGE